MHRNKIFCTSFYRRNQPAVLCQKYIFNIIHRNKTNAFYILKQCNLYSSSHGMNLFGAEKRTSCNISFVCQSEFCLSLQNLTKHYFCSELMKRFYCIFHCFNSCIFNEFLVDKLMSVTSRILYFLSGPNIFLSSQSITYKTILIR